MFANTKAPGSGSLPDVCTTPGTGPVPIPYPNMGTVPASDVVTNQVVIGPIAPMLPGQDPAGAPLPMPKILVTIINP